MEKPYVTVRCQDTGFISGKLVNHVPRIGETVKRCGEYFKVEDVITDFDPGASEKDGSASVVVYVKRTY